MSPRLVAFDSGHLNERGTDVALYDYADFNELVLGHRSLILCPAEAEITSIDRFRARFPLAFYRSRADLDILLRNVDFYYKMVEGSDNGEPTPRPPNGRVGVHCVFRADQPHGDVYASISEWVSRHYSADHRVPAVPYVVRPASVAGDLRAELGIPADATVFGRHGGLHTFNIPFAVDVVRTVVRERNDAWFVFLNTTAFDDHPRVCFLPQSMDPAYKAAFLETSDAMLHARAEGETFGLAVAEFSVHNKPVITWLGSQDLYHVEVLGNKGIYYRTPDDLARILRTFRPVTGDFDAYAQRFAPQRVMAQFESVFQIA